jgi:hypothetical protein
LALGVIGMAVTSKDNVFQGPLTNEGWVARPFKIMKAEGPAPLGGTHDCAAHHTSAPDGNPLDVVTRFRGAGDTLEAVCIVWNWTGCEPNGDSLTFRVGTRTFKIENDWGGYCIPAGSWWLMYWVWWPPPRGRAGPTVRWSHQIATVTPLSCDGTPFTLY